MIYQRRPHGDSTLADQPAVPDVVASVPRPARLVQDRRGIVRPLRGVNLDIHAGEIVGIVGESGSGKSVLGLSLLGLLPRDPAPQVRGSALVCGVDMVSASAEERRLVRKHHLGAVFQDPITSLNPTMRVGKQVVEAAGSKTEALRLLDAVGMPEPGRRFTQYPHELSGGLRQRVMIALALGGRGGCLAATSTGTGTAAPPSRPPPGPGYRPRGRGGRRAPDRRSPTTSRARRCS